MKTIIYGLIITVTILGTIWLREYLNVYDWVLRDMDYQKNIEINAYALTKDQLANYFCHHEPPVQIHPMDPAFRDICYVLVEMKNRGYKDYWGTLRCCVLGSEYVIIPISHSTQSQEADVYRIYVADLGGAVFIRNGTATTISYEWKDLYTK